MCRPSEQAQVYPPSPLLFQLTYISMIPPVLQTHIQSHITDTTSYWQLTESLNNTFREDKALQRRYQKKK